MGVLHINRCAAVVSSLQFRGIGEPPAEGVGLEGGGSAGETSNFSNSSEGHGRVWWRATETRGLRPGWVRVQSG
jgi:hypothetical protein